MRLLTRLGLPFLLAASVATAWSLHSPARAAAQVNQIEMFQDDLQLLANPGATLQQLRELGVGVVRVSVHWGSIAPTRRTAGFNATNPASYPARSWSVYDEIVNDARQDGIAVDFSVGGAAPPWALAPGEPPAPPGFGAWKPSAAAFKQFLQALGTRYSGTYDPSTDKSTPGAPNDLPRVSFWEVWNEPNFGEDLAPQAINGSSVEAAPSMYRNLLDAGWEALQSTGHGRDTIVIGNLDARGQSAKPSRGAPQGLPGIFAATKPMQFIRWLYCVSSSYKELRGAAAAAVGCPTTPAASRRFRAAHPALFQASGFATHPYPVNLPPSRASSTDPDYTEFSELPRLASALDRIQRMYGSGKRFPIYNNEYGYITNPPNASLTPLNPHGQFVSPTTAAYYINWAEYISWRNPRIASTAQYLLVDPNPRKAAGAPEFGGFASGLIFYSGARKPAYDAYRLPLFLPVTTARRGQSLEVWGCVRPADFARLDTAGIPQQVHIQFQRGSSGPYTTLRTVTATNVRGYIDLRVTFPASGSVRLAWSYPTTQQLPTSSPTMPVAGETVYSRTQTVTVK
ncbi:MAG: hypothetical protein JOZ95_11435 [Solirubrobacterales bacterium]|nr:hypothetical protein [Solirubrobacterales bacterium]MBV9365012.1 hypothetical protein [Solirubrobacterales bacterium]